MLNPTHDGINIQMGNTNPINECDFKFNEQFTIFVSLHHRNIRVGFFNFGLTFQIYQYNLIFHPNLPLMFIANYDSNSNSSGIYLGEHHSAQQYFKYSKNGRQNYNKNEEMTVSLKSWPE